MKKLLIVFIACLALLTGCSSSGNGSSNSGDATKIANKGDIVKIDFVGKMNGEVFDGGSASGQVVELGAGMYIAGFEEGIIGMSLGETKYVNLTFPTNYYEELAGKAVTFEITVKDIYKSVK